MKITRMTRLGKETLEVDVVCPRCLIAHALYVSPLAYSSWKLGDKTLQEAFPEGDAYDRAAIAMGTCRPCSMNLFGKWEET